MRIFLCLLAWSYSWTVYSATPPNVCVRIIVSNQAAYLATLEREQTRLFDGENWFSAYLTVLQHFANSAHEPLNTARDFEEAVLHTRIPSEALRRYQMQAEEFGVELVITEEDDIGFVVEPDGAARIEIHEDTSEFTAYRLLAKARYWNLIQGRLGEDESIQPISSEDGPISLGFQAFLYLNTPSGQMAANALALSEAKPAIIPRGINFNQTIYIHCLPWIEGILSAMRLMRWIDKILAEESLEDIHGFCREHRSQLEARVRRMTEELIENVDNLFGQARHFDLETYPNLRSRLRRGVDHSRERFLRFLEEQVPGIGGYLNL